MSFVSWLSKISFFQTFAPDGLCLKHTSNRLPVIALLISYIEGAQNPFHFSLNLL